jgi:hypothetical protein
MPLGLVAGEPDWRQRQLLFPSPYKRLAPGLASEARVPKFRLRFCAFLSNGIFKMPLKQIRKKSMSKKNSHNKIRGGVQSRFFKPCVGPVCENGAH